MYKVGVWLQASEFVLIFYQFSVDFLSIFYLFCSNFQCSYVEIA